MFLQKKVVLAVKNDNLFKTNIHKSESKVKNSPTSEWLPAKFLHMDE